MLCQLKPRQVVTGGTSVRHLLSEDEPRQFQVNFNTVRIMPLMCAGPLPIENLLVPKFFHHHCPVMFDVLVHMLPALRCITVYNQSIRSTTASCIKGTMTNHTAKRSYGNNRPTKPKSYSSPKRRHYGRIHFSLCTC